MGDLWWLIPSGVVLFGMIAGMVTVFVCSLLYSGPPFEEDEPVPKTPWEDRVKMLLTKPEIVWYYKAPDGKMYGGQPRIDFIASDIFGRFIMIEVKALPDEAKSFVPKSLVPAVQQDALDRIAGTASGVAILAVGHESVLRLYNWGAIRERDRVSVDGAQSEGTFWMGVWNGPANWAQHNLHVIMAKHWRSEPGPYSGLGPLAHVSTASAWTKPYPDLTVPESSSLILPPGMRLRPIAPTRTGLEAMMSASDAWIQAASTVGPTLEPIQIPMVNRAKPVPPAPPPEKTSGEKRKEILKKANRQHHARQ